MKIMETQIFKGDKVKDPILLAIQQEISAWYNEFQLRPGIAFIGYANVPLGKYNIPFHVKSAETLGFKVFNLVQPDNLGEEGLLATIDQVNENPDIHTIELLQPLPPQINPLRVMTRIRPDKEAEGFHPENMMYSLFPGYRERNYQMCLPTALTYIFNYFGHVVPENSEWVLVLDKGFYENPLVNMVARTALMKSVPDTGSLTVVNTGSSRLPEYVKRADYLVVVTKTPGLIKPEWLKTGVGIIDIYSNLVSEVPSQKDPRVLVPLISGGVDPKSTEGKASFIVPVPGGLMPVVLALMFRNALNQFAEQHKTLRPQFSF